MVIKENLEHLGTFRDWSDGTIKSVYKNDKGSIESTLIFNKTDRGSDVYCVPSHHYCNLGCKMCHLTKEGSGKGMIPVGYQDMIESVSRTAYSGRTGERWSNNKNGWIAFMGAGDPLMNLEMLGNVFEREEEVKKNCGYLEMTYALSTMMPNKRLGDLADYVVSNSMPLKVHFSLHSPFDSVRSELIPKSAVNIEEALGMLSSYRNCISGNDRIRNNFKIFKRSFNPVEIHYTLIKGINDSKEDFEEVSKYLDEFRIPFKILRFNSNGNLDASGKDEEWVGELSRRFPDLKIRCYNPPGHQVGSSCGEFTKHYYLSDMESAEEFREFKEWEEKHRIE